MLCAPPTEGANNPPAVAANKKTPAATSSEPFAGHKLAKYAKLDISRAREIALNARPGKIVDQELEKEAGGSGYRYSFDVLADGKTYEVGVDAKDGRVLENKAEGKHPD